MYHLAVLILLGLTLFKIVDLLEDYVPGLTRFHALFTLVLGVAGAYILDYSVFDGWGVSFRDADMGMWITGFAIAGMTSVWRAALHWLGSSEGDEPEVRHITSGRARAA